MIEEMTTIKKMLLAMVFCWSVALFAQTKFYVSPKGNDANKGTQIKPFASIEKAWQPCVKHRGR